MLIGIDPLLNGELLKILDEMGHGDQLLLVGRNYPAAASGKPVIRLGDVTTVRAISAISTVFPLDSFIERPLARMEVDNDPSIVTTAQAEVLAIASAATGKTLEFDIVPRLDFYARAKRVYAAVQTLNAHPNGGFILPKGAVLA